MGFQSSGKVLPVLIPHRPREEDGDGPVCFGGRH